MNSSTILKWKNGIDFLENNNTLINDFFLSLNNLNIFGIKSSFEEIISYRNEKPIKLNSSENCDLI